MLFGLPWPVFALSLATGLGMTLAVMSVTVTPSAGLQTAPEPWLASVPYGLQFCATMLAAYPLTALFATFGRKPVVLASVVLGVLAGGFSYFGVRSDSFLLLCLGTCSLGVFMAALASLRFAASELVTNDNRARALALTNFGGTFAAILGPSLAILAPSLLQMDFRQAVYLMMIVVVLVMSLLVLATPFGAKPGLTPVQAQSNAGDPQAISSALFVGTIFLFITFCGATSYGIMSGMMTATGLEMEQVGIADAPRTQLIQFHVLAMFGPSLVTGSILQRLGQRRFLTLGIVLLAAAPLTGLLAPAYWAFAASLIFLGFGWNFLYVGGSAIIAARFQGNDKFRSQGLYDTAASLFSAVATLSAAMILAQLSWNGLMVAAVVMIAIMILFAIVSGFGERGSPTA